MTTQIIIEDDYGVYHVKIDQVEDFAHLSAQSTKNYPSFAEDALYFPNTLGNLEDGTPCEMVVQDIYDMIEAHEYGISLSHLRKLFEEIDVTGHLEMLISEWLVRAVKMTPRCIIYKVCD